MRSLTKKVVRKILAAGGYRIERLSEDGKLSEGKIVELDRSELEFVNHVMDSGYTMTSIPRLVNTLKACRYVLDNNIRGDFVECGVWRGGNGILAKKIFQYFGSDKKVWMFDTFEGMTKPTDFDVEASTNVGAEKKYSESQQESHNEWCFASLEDVKKNCVDSGLGESDFYFVKGDVCQTLRMPENVPSEISVLRLDTDWYESTKVELEVLYPNLAERGVLIIDDYGHWEGSRKAVDEYFSSKNYKPLFNVIDYTGRSAIKCEVK